MTEEIGAVFDPETIELMEAVLDDAWASLRPDQRANFSRTDLAARILKSASQGERDPVRLRAQALISMARLSRAS